MYILLKKILDIGYFLTNEQRGAWSTLLLALALHFPFVSHLRFSQSNSICKKLIPELVFAFEPDVLNPKTL